MKNMEKNKTAIDWLVEQVNSDCLNSTFIQPKLIEQAKAMEKQQIIDAWIATDNELQRLAAEQYYNETYNK
jgi:hypothetical protein